MPQLPPKKPPHDLQPAPLSATAPPAYIIQIKPPDGPPLTTPHPKPQISSSFLPQSAFTPSPNLPRRLPPSPSRWRPPRRELAPQTGSPSSPFRVPPLAVEVRPPELNSGDSPAKHRRTEPRAADQRRKTQGEPSDLAATATIRLQNTPLLAIQIVPRVLFNLVSL